MRHFHQTNAPYGDTMAAQNESLRTFAINDRDSQETREWLDALSAVLHAEGPERAHYLL
jgi:pyruvate dehydrogenase E1 component